MKRSSIDTKQSTEHAPARPSATPEGASKNPLTSQAEQFAEDGAPPGPQSLAAGQAQKEEPRPKIGTPWQIMLASGGLIFPALFVGGALMDDAAVFRSGMAFSPLSVSCFLLLILCDPSNRDAEKYLVPLYCLSVASFGGTMLYQGLNYAITFDRITVPLALLLCALGALYFLLLARRKIGDFARQELKDFVYKGVFWNGLGSLTPIIYLTAESLKCFLDNLEGGGLTFLADPKCDSHSLAPDRTSFSVHVSLSPSSYRMEYLFEVNLETFQA